MEIETKNITAAKNILQQNKKIEIVAPAGGWDCLIAAINGGADAVYLGYRRFSARASAENFDLAQLKKAVACAHANGVKVYLAVNTLIKDSELPELTGFLNEYLAFCRDGIIIQDLGLFKVLSDLFPSVRVHASTQLNIHNTKSIQLLSDFNFARTVLAREMTIGEISAITAGESMEIEVFAHGSQCYCYSGSCYFSSFTGLRSGNRGRCTQPCRMKYSVAALPSGRKNTGSRSGERLLLENSYVLSKSDLFTLDMLPELSRAGVTALKIEGRMKTPEYVGIVTAIYRKYIDLFYSGLVPYSVSKEDVYKVTQIYSRELGHGYFKEEFPKDIVSMKKSGSIGNFLGRITGFEYSEPERPRVLKSGFKKPPRPGYRGKNSPQAGRIKSFQIKSNWPVLIGDVLQIWTNAGNEQLSVESIKLLETKNGKYLYSIDAGGRIKAGMGDRVFKSFDHSLDMEAKSYFAGGLKNRPGKIRKDAFDDRSFTGTIPADYFGGKSYKGTGDFRPGTKAQDSSGFNMPKTSGPGISNQIGLKNLYRENLHAGTGLKVEIYDLSFAEIILNESYQYLKDIVINSFDTVLNEAGLSIGLLKSIFKRCREKGIDLIFKTPQVIYDRDLIRLKNFLPVLADIGIKYFSVSNFGVLKTLIDEAQSGNGGNANTDTDIDIDFGFNIFNHMTASFFHGLGQKYKGINIKDIGLSVELGLSEINSIVSSGHYSNSALTGSGPVSSPDAAFKPVSHPIASMDARERGFQKPGYSIYSYGYYPVMQSRFRLKYFDENKPKDLPMDYYLLDQKNYDFRIVEEFNGNISFLSSKKICTLFDLDKIIPGGTENLYIDSRTFGAGEAIEIIKTYNKALQVYNKNRPKGLEDLLAAAKNNRLFSDYTRGHLEREVL